MKKYIVATLTLKIPTEKLSEEEKSNWREQMQSMAAELRDDAPNGCIVTLALLGESDE